ncbi:unnamed protein product, partial [Rotaria sp. Silwood2]
MPSQNKSNSSEGIASLTMDKIIHANEHTTEKKNIKEIKSKENEEHVDNGESGQPFDIQMIRKGKENQIDLIEVKTTRSSTQNTFPISIREVECLISNQNNYHIYRVYYSNDEISSTITILSQIKYNLEQKHL